MTKTAADILADYEAKGWHVTTDKQKQESEHVLKEHCHAISRALGHDIQTFTKSEEGRVGFAYRPSETSWLEVEVGQGLITYVFNPDITRPFDTAGDVRHLVKGFGPYSSETIAEIRDAIA